ncbi:MAG TPA: AI-2E family transporter [Longimicrobium sp.]|nr:AI-2E family transporter [Longimicrobium sp.]
MANGTIDAKTLRQAPAYWLLAAAALVVVTLGVRTAAPMLNPILMAAFLALLFQPTVSGLGKKGVPDALGITAVVLGVVLSALGILGFMAASLRQLAGQVPVYRDQFSAQITEFAEMLASRGIPVATYVENFVQGGALGRLLVSISTGTANALGNTLLTLIIFAFVLGGMARLEDSIQAGETASTGVSARFLAFSSTIRGYMGVRAILGAAAAVLQYIILRVVGVEYALLWAVVSFVFSFIPNIGFTLSLIPPALLALVLLGWKEALIVVAGYMIVNNGIDNVIGPRFVGQQMKMSPLLSFLSVIFWAWVLGPTGAILSVPLTVFVREFAFYKGPGATPDVSTAASADATAEANATGAPASVPVATSASNASIATPASDQTGQPATTAVIAAPVVVAASTAHATAPSADSGATLTSVTALEGEEATVLGLGPILIAETVVAEVIAIAETSVAAKAEGDGADNHSGDAAEGAREG